MPTVRMLKEPTRRVRFLTPEDARRLLVELPEHLADMAAFSPATRLRVRNVTGLEWDVSRLVEAVDLDKSRPDQAMLSAQWPDFSTNLIAISVSV